MADNQPPTAQDQLGSLSPRQREVLSLVCKGLHYDQIAGQLVISENTVKATMQQVYLKLGLDAIANRTQRGRQLRQVYCPLLATGDVPEPGPQTEAIQPVSPQIVEMVEEDQKALVLWQPKPVIPASSRAVQVIEQRTTDGGTKPPRPLRWIVIGMLLGVLLIGAIAWAIVSPLIAQQQALLTQLAQPTPTSVLVTVEVPVVVTEPSPIPQTVVVTATHLPATDTPRPSNTPFLPTETPPPSETATIDAAVFSFEDNFDNGYDPQWRVLSGDPIVTEGKLGAAGNDGVTVEIGDATWSSYTVDFDFINGYCQSIRLIVAQQLRYGFCQGNWEVFKSNEWSQIADGSGPPNTGHFRLVIAGSSYTIFVNGIQFFDIKYGQPLSGPLAIVISDRTSFIDNVQITSP